MLIMSEPWAEPSDPPLPPDQSIPFDWSARPSIDRIRDGIVLNTNTTTQKMPS